MVIDEHPVHMVFAPVITKHPAIQDGEFGRQTARNSASGIQCVRWGGKKLLIGLDAQCNTNRKTERRMGR